MKSQKITQLVHMQHRKVTAARTHEQLKDFEENLRQFQGPRAEVVLEDDMPLGADAKAVQASEKTETTVIFPDNVSTDSDSPRNMTQSQKMLSRTSVIPALDTQLLDTDTDDHMHARRPPSPLAHYDYGNISLKPRSILSQQQQPQRPTSAQRPPRPSSAQKSLQQCTGGSGTMKIGFGSSVASQARPTSAQARRSSSAGGSFYFPGPDYRQGPYGFSMQDPILMPTRNWEPKRAPDRSDQHANNQRPRNHKGTGNDGGVKQSCQSKPTVPTGIRSTRGQDLKLQRVFQTLDKEQVEAGFEQQRYEEGNFGGKWAHPLNCRHSNFISDNIENHPVNILMDRSLEDSDEVALLASRILSGLTNALQTRHSTLQRLFWAVNGGTPGVLDLEEFIDGLVRLQILEGAEVVTLKVLSEAMSLIDPCFDGRVNYPALTRAITHAQGVQRGGMWTTTLNLPGSIKPATNRAGDGCRGPTVDVCTRYGSELPAEHVTVTNSKSVYDFSKTMEKFRKQQASLLSYHGERSDY